MNRFVSTLNTWLLKHPSVSLRQIAIDANVDPSMLSMIRKEKRTVTFDAISKLLPTIERYSDRTSAVTLLIAYLRDETPDTHADAIRIEAIDHTGQPQADIYQQLSRRWEQVARLDTEFMAMWQGMDHYMHTPEALTVGTRQPPDQTTPEHDAETESPIALLAEPLTPYNKPQPPSKSR